jgi:hypothetical protein
MDVREAGMDMANWIRLAQDRVQWLFFVNAVMNLRNPYESRTFFDRLRNIQLFKQCPAGYIWLRIGTSGGLL